MMFNDSIITFGKKLPKINDYDSYFWPFPNTKTVEFFPNTFFTVTLISVNDPNLKFYLQQIHDDCISESKNDPEITKYHSKIAIDLEWEIELNLFQFCSPQRKILIIRHPDGKGNEILFNFLTSHLFYGKGIDNDVKQLQRKFEYLFPHKKSFDFLNIIEDVSKTRLIPYGYSSNFIQMTKQFAGNPCADFKDAEMTMSNWLATDLTVRQVLYAAFDVAAIYQCYPNFKPAKAIEMRAKNRKSKFSKMSDETNMRIKRKYANKAKIIVLHNHVEKVYPFLIDGYSGPLNPIDIRLFFQDNDIDFVSPFFYNNKIIVFSAFKQPVNEYDLNQYLRGYCDGLRQLPDEIDYSECTDRDFLFITNIPSDLFDEYAFSTLLYCFGVNFHLQLFESGNNKDTEINQGFILVEPRSALSSYLIQVFLQAVFNMKVYTFPRFLPKIRIDNIPHSLYINEMNTLFSNSISIKFLRCPNEETKQTCFVEFHTNEEAETAINTFNYTNCSNLINDSNSIELRIARYTTEDHLKFLKLFELFVHNCSSMKIDSSQLLRNYFSKYGEIYQAYYDPFFEIGHVQFYERKNAIQAIKSETTLLRCEIVPENRVFIIRDVSFNVQNQELLELCSPFGQIQDIQTRDLTSYMRYSIKEITYATSESAYAARLNLFSKTIKGNTIRVSVLNGGNVEAASWKNNQKKQWIIVRHFINNDFHLSISDLYKECSKYGNIVKYQIHSNGTDACIMFSDEQYVDVLNKYYKRNHKLKHFHLDSPDNTEFVSVLNPNELKLDFITKKDKANIKNEMIKLKEIEGTEEEAVVVILFRTLKHNKDHTDIYSADDRNSKISLPKKPIDPLMNENELSVESINKFRKEFEGLYQIYLSKEEDRAIIHAQSKGIIKQIFKMFWQEGRFNPIRIKYKDIENPPLMVLNHETFSSHNKILSKLNSLLNGIDGNKLNELATIVENAGNEKIIVLDPVPKSMDETIIKQILIDYDGKFELIITGSLQFGSQKRALFFGKNHTTRKKILRDMNGAFKGQRLKSIEVLLDVLLSQIR